MKPSEFEHSTYPVNNIYPSIQGEGVHTGKPVTFVRLHGCDVGCPWCDTKETWVIEEARRERNWVDALAPNDAWGLATAEEIASYCSTLRPNWVVITGGEPALYNLAPLVAALHGRGIRVSLETSGTEAGFIGAGIDWVTVSPKFGMPGGKKVLPDALAHADEIKMVVGKKEDIHTLLTAITDVRMMRQTQVVLQPVSQSRKATDLCIEACMAYNWRLSIQVHKYIQVP